MMSRVLEISRNFRPQPETPSSTETSHIAPTRTDGQISPQSQPDTCEISEISEIRCRLGASWFELMCQIDDLGIARVYDGKATYPGDMPPFQKVLADQTDWLPGDEYPGEEEEDTGYRTEDSESDYVPF